MIHVSSGQTAEVSRVLIQRVLVREDIHCRLSKDLEFIDSEFGQVGCYRETLPRWLFGTLMVVKCYQFTVKSYNKANHEVYRREMDNFQGISDIPGIVSYYGYFIEKDEDSNGTVHMTKNILLEYGDLDLDEYLVGKLPLTIRIEIIDFWERLFRVATTLKKFQNLEVQRHRYAGFVSLCLHFSTRL